MTIDAIKLLISAYDEAIAEMGGSPKILDGELYETIVHMIRMYCAGWRHAKDDT